jgi:hypothetical protein
VRPVRVAAYLEVLQKRMAAYSRIHQLAAIQILSDWLVVSEGVQRNRASSVKGPKHVVEKGTPPCFRPNKPWR